MARVDSPSFSEAYLYQCLTGRRDMGPAEARRVVDATNGELHLWDICQATWGAIWPELMSQAAAPDFAETKMHAASMRVAKEAA